MLALRNNPFSTMASLRDEMDRVFGGFVAPNELCTPAFSSSGETAFAPALNVWEDDHALQLEAELPGLRKEDLDITIDGQRLTIRGERAGETVDENRQFHRRERWGGRFMRSITLPTSVDASAASASLENGILSLTFPKREEVRPRKITVKTT